MSNRTNNNATEPHHLKIDLGSDRSVQAIKFLLFGHISYNYATAINLYASNDNSSWVKVISLQGMKYAYNSDMIKASNKYRYWRFDVVATTGK